MTKLRSNALWLSLSLFACCLGFTPGRLPHHNVRCDRFSLAAVDQENNHVQETKASLAEKLTRQLSAIQEETNDPDPSTARLSLLRKRLPLCLNRTAVGPSTVLEAGRGLFAVMDCQKGDLLTCYPGDALLETPDDDLNWKIQWGDHVAPEHQQSLENLDDTLLAGYTVFVDDDYGVLGLPEYSDNPAYLGHFANDGATMPIRDADLSTYMLESNECQNAMHQSIGCGSVDDTTVDDENCEFGCHMITVATRDIMAGEEVFVTYGPDYWREQPSFVGHDDDELDIWEGASSTSLGKGFG